MCFIDLMAGEGYYASGDAGSTGTLVEVAKDNLRAGRPVRCISVEANNVAFERLQANTAEAGAFVESIHGRWEDLVGDLLMQTDGEFTFFFVDPMGIREIDWAHLEQLVRRDNTELLINFNSTVASRLAGSLGSEKVGSEGRVERLNKVMGGDYWQTGYAEARRRHETQQHLTEVYAKHLGEIGGFGVCWTPIRETGLTGRTKYHLVFASRHRKAFEIMNDILFRQKERLSTEIAESAEVPLLEMDPEWLARQSEENQLARETHLVRALAESLAADNDLRGHEVTVGELFLSRL